MKAIKINKNGHVSKRSIDDILKLNEVGNVSYMQGNVLKWSKVRGSDEVGYFAMNPLITGAPYLAVIKYNENFAFNL